MTSLNFLNAGVSGAASSDSTSKFREAIGEIDEKNQKLMAQMAEMVANAGSFEWAIELALTMVAKNKEANGAMTSLRASMLEEQDQQSQGGGGKGGLGGLVGPAATALSGGNPLAGQLASTFLGGGSSSASGNSESAEMLYQTAKKEIDAAEQLKSVAQNYGDGINENIENMWR